MASFGRMKRATLAPAATRACSRSAWLARWPIANSALAVSQVPDDGGAGFGGRPPLLVFPSSADIGVGAVGTSVRAPPHPMVNPPMVMTIAITLARVFILPRAKGRRLWHAAVDGKTDGAGWLSDFFSVFRRGRAPGLSVIEGNEGQRISGAGSAVTPVAHEQVSPWQRAPSGEGALHLYAVERAGGRPERSMARAWPAPGPEKRSPPGKKEANRDQRLRPARGARRRNRGHENSARAVHADMRDSGRSDAIEEMRGWGVRGGVG